MKGHQLLSRGDQRRRGALLHSAAGGVPDGSEIRLERTNRAAPPPRNPNTVPNSPPDSPTTVTKRSAISKIIPAVIKTEIIT